MSASELRPDDRAPNLWLSGEVIIGDVQIGANVVIEGPARIGDGAVIEHGALIGKRPALAPHSSAGDGDSDDNGTVIGEGATICAGAIIFAGASKVANHHPTWSSPKLCLNDARSRS